MDEVLHMLRCMDIMPRDARQRTKSIDARTKRGFVLGTVLMYSDTMFRVSQHTFRHKELTKALCKLGRESFPNFPFTSIMVNKDGCPLHVDRNNCGPSMICSLGKHIGGQLWQWPGEVLDIHNELSSLMDCFRMRLYPSKVNDTASCSIASRNYEHHRVKKMRNC